jgi:hypothetical protein
MALGWVQHPNLPMVPLLMNHDQLNMELGEEMLGMELGKEMLGMELKLVEMMLMKLLPLMLSLSPLVGISI